MFSPVKNHLRTRDHYFVAFPPHLLDQDCDLHFATRIDLESAGCFCVIYLERNVGTGLASQAFANMSGGYVFSFATSKGRVIDQNSHADRGRIDVHELKRRPFFEVSECFADVNLFETGETDDVASAGVLYFDLLSIPRM